MSSVNKIWQTKLEPKADPYLTSILVGCLKINPKERFNLKALLECLLLTDYVKEQYEEIILSRLSLLA